MEIALSQIAPTISKNNKAQHISEIKRAVSAGAEVIVFPELSLNGYKMMDGALDFSYKIDELKIFKEMSSKIDILLGCSFDSGDKVYNSAVYFSGGGIAHMHNKINLPNYKMFEEARYFFKGTELRSFNVRGKNCVVGICEDFWSSGIVNYAAELNPDIVYIIANSPARGFDDEGLAITREWDSILRASANYCGAPVLFCNRVGFEDGIGFWGGSTAVLPNGSMMERMAIFAPDFRVYGIDSKITKVSKYMRRNRV